MKTDELVSIVLPYFNGKQFVLDTLESIRNQTFSNFEVIVVDDGSTLKEHSEHLSSLIDSFSDSRFRYIFKANGGLSDARNFGINNSNGTWIAFIDQDDIWEPTKLERQMDVVLKNIEVNFIFTDAKFIGDIQGDMQVASKNGLQEGIIVNSYERLLKGNFVTCSSILFRKSLVAEVGNSNPSFKICPDYEFIIRFAEHTDFYFIHDNLVLYRIHGANTVKNELKMAAENILLLCDRKIETPRGKLLATYNLLNAIFSLSLNWIRKLIL